jgi:DNA-directed RNA polymerase specialized sigma24 family protein
MKEMQESGAQARGELPGELGWHELPELMSELRDLARRLLTRWPGMESLQPTLLVSTALRRQRRANQDWGEITWENRRQLFGQVFRAMRQKLIEYRRHQVTRGYRSQRRVSVAEMELFDAWRSWTEDPQLALALEAALAHLGEHHPELAEVVEYRFFCGLTWNDVARMQECSLATVKRKWDKARTLMHTLLQAQLDA